MIKQDRPNKKSKVQIEHKNSKGRERLPNSPEDKDQLIQKLKEKIRSQAHRLLTLEQTKQKDCGKCLQLNEEVQSLKSECKELKEVLRAEVILNESMSAYLDMCQKKGQVVHEDWRARAVSRDSEVHQYVTDLLVSMGTDDEKNKNDALEVRIKDLTSKRDADLLYISQIKAEMDTKLLNATKTKENLESDVSSTHLD